jgi:hypothetical protein
MVDTRVVYHNGFSQDGIGVYEEGAFPWLDLLVQLGGAWYGPEREPGDGIQAAPLPDGYRWQTAGSFGSLPNGEAWWAESNTEGIARLIGPTGTILVELPLRIMFKSSGSDDDGGEQEVHPTPT